MREKTEEKVASIDWWRKEGGQTVDGSTQALMIEGNRQHKTRGGAGGREDRQKQYTFPELPRFSIYTQLNNTRTLHKLQMVMLGLC